MIIKYFALLLILTTAASAQWIKQTVNTTASFRGLSVVDQKIVWASGTGGTVIKTTDGGKTWKVMTVPGAEKLDFRDIEAFDQFTAYVLSIGNGDSSRIYKTIDGGKKWNLEFQNTNEKAFFDAIACTSNTNCIAMSDPVDDKFLIAQSPRASLTRKGFPSKSSWELGEEKFRPLAQKGEAAFAASGTCLIVHGDSAFMVTGGASARVFRSNSYALDWLVADTPFRHGTAGSGIFSIAMHGAINGVIVGGDYEKPNEAKDNLAFTTDGGKTWTLATGLTGYRSAVTYIDEKTIIAVGTNGTDLTTDGGETWKKIGSEDLNAVAAKGKNAVWAVGPKGTVAKLK